MIHAALDSSILCSLVIADDNRILFNQTLESASRDNDRKLPPWIQNALASCNLTLSDIRRWTVGTGPGSFAGLRSGIALIMGFCTATGAQLRGVPSVIATAAAATPQAGQRVGVIMDGRCGEIILATVKDGRLAEETVALLPENLLQDSYACDLWITPQAALLPPLPEAIQKQLKTIDAINPETLLFNQAVEWPADTAATIRSCEPIYVRPPVFVKPVEPLNLLA